MCSACAQEDAFQGLSKLKVLWLTGNHYQMGEKGYKKMKAPTQRETTGADCHFQQYQGDANKSHVMDFDGGSWKPTSASSSETVRRAFQLAGRSAT